MRNLRAIYNKAVLKGWIVGGKEDLFKKVYTGVAPSPKRALSAPEMQCLENLLSDSTTLTKSEKEALHLFLFSFHARGISFVDMAFLKKEDIREGHLCYKRRKTGSSLQVAVNRKMLEHLAFFKERTEGSPYLFPLISPFSPSVYRSYEKALKKQNMSLHKIAAKAGLTSLTTHMARHSWATIAKKKLVPLWVISEALGHQSLKATYIYLDSFGNSVLDKAALKVSSVLRGPC